MSMSSSLPMICGCMAFFFCGLSLVSNPLCQVTGPMAPECKKLAGLSVPLASLSGCAAILLVVMSGGGLSSFRQ